MNKKILLKLLFLIVLGFIGYLCYNYYMEAGQRLETAEKEYIEALRKEQAKPQPRVKAIKLPEQESAPVATSGQVSTGGKGIAPISRPKGAR